jgi:hypothetical protein
MFPNVLWHLAIYKSQPLHTVGVSEKANMMIKRGTLRVSPLCWRKENLRCCFASFIQVVFSRLNRVGAPRKSEIPETFPATAELHESLAKTEP